MRGRTDRQTNMSIRLFLRMCSAILLLSPAAFAQRTVEKPPWNAYSPQTDIEEGRKFAMQIERQEPMCNDPRVDAYLTQLGMKLVAKLPTNGVNYPWEFHCVNDKSINAFALPGGFVFINRGAIEAADNEAQLAGVMAHELSHVALRHGTAQASKGSAVQLGTGILGAIFGGSVAGALATQGAAIGAGSVLLHYSRSAETQADVMGTQVLYDTGYDPRAMAQFFEKIEAESQGKNPPQFFSDHPNPGNRVERVNEEIDKLGGLPTNPKRDSQDFESVKREVMALPVVKKGQPGALSASARTAGPPPKPEMPSASLSSYRGQAYELSYPDNWKKFGDGNSVAFAPQAGIVDDGSGHGALAYGMSVSIVAVPGDRGASDALQNATQSVIADLQKTNPNLKVIRAPGNVRLSGSPALSTYLSNDSPGGGAETDWLITVIRPEGLMYFVCTAPQADYNAYDKTFAAILDSVRFAQ